MDNMNANEPHLQTEQATESDVINEIIGGGSDLEAFGIMTSEDAPSEPTDPTMVQQPPQQQVQSQEDPNDYVRARYWQSQADKRQNELEALKQELEAVKNPQRAQQEPEHEKFPDPPMEPQRPLNFNQEEAFTDPSSESAQYMRQMQNYQTEVMNYNILKTEWAAQQMQMERENYRQEVEYQRQVAEQQRARVEEDRQIATQVMREKGVDARTAMQFVQTFREPQPTMDQLWNLFLIQQGQTPQVQRPQVPAHMQQMRQAQRTVPPLGTMPSQDHKDLGRSQEDMIMDNMIDAFNKENPFS